MNAYKANLNDGFFMADHELDTNHLTEWEKTIAVMYWSFTSLSTVGFGDFHPTADAERLVGAFVLLFGVAIFSYIMGIFIEILDQFRNMNEDFDEGDKLDCFFIFLMKLNNGMPMPKDFKTRVEDLFQYKW